AEIERQEELVRGGGAVDQETLHFDTQSRTLSLLRSKEYAHDYRYFPAPDLVPPVPTQQMLERARPALPGLPAVPARRFVSDRGMAMAGDDELESIVSRAIEADPAAVEEIKSGNQKAIGALMGGVMRETKGRADGKEVQRLIRERIGA